MVSNFYMFFSFIIFNISFSSGEFLSIMSITWSLSLLRDWLWVGEYEIEPHAFDRQHVIKQSGRANPVII